MGGIEVTRSNDVEKEWVNSGEQCLTAKATK